MEVLKPSVYSAKAQPVTFDRFEACLLCSSAQLTSLRGYEQHYLVQCTVCDFIFCSRKPTMDELNAHYALYPRARGISEITLKRYNELLETFEPYRKTNNIIDVGCGDGYFLEVAKKRKWNVFGTEFTKEAIEVCQQKGIQMTVSPLDPKKYPSDFFDIITSFEVIEHINSPVEEVSVFAKILRPGGVAYITTPNFNSVSRLMLGASWNVIEYPEHLCYYTKKALTNLFEHTGFKLNVASTTGISISRFNRSVQARSSAVAIHADEILREKSETEIVFILLKRSVNFFLNLVSKGDSLKAYFIKR